MRSTIFIPKKINVGFQNRSDTYTKKLAYIIYYDEKGKLRKENSWNSWRDNNIEPIEFENTPTSGFVLNKKVGDYDSGWNHRHAYVRVYDPRNFEFEINIENLLYILENTSSIKGKGLEGEFVYGWDGKDLVLMPTSSPDYTELSKLNKLRHEGKKFKGKDLKIGGTYLDKNNRELIYMGRYDYHGCKSYKKAYFFYNKNNRFENYASIGTVLIDCVSEECVSDYADIFDKMEYYENYNPYDSTRDEYLEHTVETFANYIMSKYSNSHEYYSKDYYIKCNRSKIIKYYLIDKPVENNDEYNTNYYRSTLHQKRYYREEKYYTDFYIKDNMFKWYVQTKIIDNEKTYYNWNTKYKTVKKDFECTIQEFVERYKPMWKKEYLKDGKLRKVVCFDEQK